MLLISIYRVLFVPVTVFLVEIVQLFEYLIAQKDDFLLAGDVNIHMETDEVYSNKFKDIQGTLISSSMFIFLLIYKDILLTSLEH